MPNTDLNPIAQLHVARRNRLACIVGAIPGIVPIGTYRLGHSELTSWDPSVDPKAWAAYAGLAFSLLTVVSWAASAFATQNRLETAIKALGFTVLVETLMMTSSSSVLSIGCLVLLVVVNAVANGCRLAVRAAAEVAPTVAEVVPMAAPSRKKIGRRYRAARPPVLTVAR
ncbi:MAG TPA: hypothetical protein VLN57_21105 [Xanthobacteraceae bacterium]|nr:hypothetical protein [Xanthobacteraceae bacterium]